LSIKGSPDELQGNTLRVYWVMLQNSKGSVGPRDVQRRLGFSSPNLAVYHLDKLVELGLATKQLGEYYLADSVGVGFFRQFAKVGGVVFPRQMLYASMWTTLFVFLVLTLRSLTFYSLFALIFGLLGLIIFWFEAWKTWSSRPR
jgi:hypothetical protein